MSTEMNNPESGVKQTSRMNPGLVGLIPSSSPDWESKKVQALLQPWHVAWYLPHGEDSKII